MVVGYLKQCIAFLLFYSFYNNKYSERTGSTIWSSFPIICKEGVNKGWSSITFYTYTIITIVTCKSGSEG